jgi:hypothetical protein
MCTWSRPQVLGRGHRVPVSKEKRVLVGLRREAGLDRILADVANVTRQVLVNPDNAIVKPACPYRNTELSSHVIPG